MYCTQCGTDNSERALYCRKCGVLLENEVQTRVAARGRTENPDVAVKGPVEPRKSADENPEDDVEEEIFSICPTLLFVKIGYVLAAIGALFLVALTAAFTSIPSGWAVAAGLLLFLIPAFYHFKQKLVRYRLTETKLEIDEGFIARRTRNLPIKRIQDVTVSTNIMQRLLGFGDLVVDNASDDNEKVTLTNINKPRYHADVLLRQMKRLER